MLMTLSSITPFSSFLRKHPESQDQITYIFISSWAGERKKQKKKKGSFKSTVAIVWTEYNHGSTDNPPQSEMSEVVLQRWSVVT